MSSGKRYTIVPVEVVENFSSVCKIFEKKDEFLECIRAKFYDFNILTIIKMLAVLRKKNPSGYRMFFHNSGVKSPKTFLNYRNLCLECGLIFKFNRKYWLSNNGKTLLELFRI